MSGSPSLAARALLAVALMAGFYLLALGIAAILLWIPIAEYQLANRIHLNLLAGCVIGAGIILWSIVPRPDRFQAPGPRLERARHPELFAALDDVARATDQTMPAEVFLVPEVNAWVAERGGMMGVGGRRVMGLGLPLMQALTVAEMRAVLAHEFGHYHAGDTRLGPWVHRTRATIGRTLQGLAHHSGLLQRPFAWYGNMFLRVTHAVSRAQEFAADALAARVAGAAALQSGLRRIHAAAQAFTPYWEVEVVPVLQAGFRPPLAEGFSRFSARPAVASAMASSIEDALREERSDPYDTHPPLAERIAGVEGIVPTAATGDPRPAVALLSDVAGVEKELLESMVHGGPPDATLQPLRWEEVGARVVLPAWERAVEMNASWLADLRVDALPESLRALDALAARVAKLDPALPGDERRGVARWLIGVAIGVLLVRAGGILRSLPGEPVMVAGPGGDVNPLALVEALARDEIPAEDWVARMAGLGLAGRALATAPARGGPG